jgi:hypothetical protein
MTEKDRLVARGEGLAEKLRDKTNLDPSRLEDGLVLMIFVSA